MERSVLIFAYGSNMDLAQMKERCPNSDLQSFIAEARSWKLCFPRYSENRNGGVGSIGTRTDTGIFCGAPTGAGLYSSSGLHRVVCPGCEAV